MVTKHSYYNYEAIWERHPEMILVSESPVTWHGFLIITRSLCAYNFQSSRIRLKLIMPAYPLFDDVHVKFGRQIASLQNKEFHKKMNELIKAACKTEQTVSLFLTQLQSLIVSIKYKYKIYFSFDNSIMIIYLQTGRIYVQYRY